MNRRAACLVLLVSFALLIPYRCPAPLIYRPGEGWVYEQVGAPSWIRTRAQDQLEVAQAAFEKNDCRLALKSARRVVRQWPYSDYAPQAQYLVGKCYAARGMDEKAFKEYQKLLERYPKVENFDEVANEQYEIADRYLNGQWFRLWGYIPLYKSMDKTVDMFEKVIKNGPFSNVAPQAQLNIGAAREKQKDFVKAAKAYEKAADVYHDNKKVAADALFLAGTAHNKQAKSAEYDQSVAGKAIAAFSDFNAMYPNDPRAPQTQDNISALKTEQARGSFAIAKYYEKRRYRDGALIYYNEVLIKDPDSEYADLARKRIAALKNQPAE